MFALSRHSRPGKTIRPWLLAILAASAASPLLASTDRYNIKIGDMMMDFSLFAEYGYNDNVTAVPKHAVHRDFPDVIGPLDDTYISYGAKMGFRWALSEDHRINFDIGANWVDYTDLNYLDSSQNTITITPESKIEFTLLLGPVEVRIYDEFSYSLDPSNAVLIDDERRAISFQVDKYGRWTNKLGLDATAVLNPLELSVGVSNFNIYNTDSEFNFTRREEWTVETMVYYPMARGKGAGLVASWTDNAYKYNVLSDSTGFYFGGVFDWELSPVTAFTARGGHLTRDYEAERTIPGDKLQSKGWVYSLEMLHLLGKNFNHKLSYSHFIGYGRATNEQVSDTLAWDFLFQGLRKTDIRGGIQWVEAKDSGPKPFAEDYNLLFANIALEYSLTEKIDIVLEYRYIDKDSDNRDRSFTQNAASIRLNYDL